MDNNLAIQLYQSIADNREPRVFKHWHASSIAECPRAHYFMRLGIPPTQVPSASKILRWEAGHHLESAIREHISNLFPEQEVLSNERITSKELDLTGEYDNYVPEAKTLVEVKSVHDYAFKETDAGIFLKEKIGESPNGRNRWGAKMTPYLHHELQNHAYAILLGEENVEQIVYVYISLSGRLSTYRTNVKEELLATVRKRLEILNKAWEAKEMPDCICGDHQHPLYDPVMQWCDYRTDDGCCDPLLEE